MSILSSEDAIGTEHKYEYMADFRMLNILNFEWLAKSLRRSSLASARRTVDARIHTQTHANSGMCLMPNITHNATGCDIFGAHSTGLIKQKTFPHSLYSTERK